MNKIILKLFVTGRTLRTRNAIANLESICKNELDDRYELTVIDVLERPQLAENEKIMATPTLIRELPPPVRRIIGDLSDQDKVLIGLDLQKPAGEE